MLLCHLPAEALKKTFHKRQQKYFQILLIVFTLALAGPQRGTNGAADKIFP
jgi:hypothetical protein